MTDNYYKNCPPMMSDGRLFTDFRSATRREETNKYINNIVRDDEYRVFLESNGEKIIDTIWDQQVKNNSCWVNECVHNYPTRVYPPWFTDERRAYNSLVKTTPDRKLYECPKMNDYRITHTNSTKY